ncbi:MAG TPA: VOC family protein [Streptosporangiaceae bacterium]|nr:VOC family protein [Streptosporangiaceae bacterium]
MRPVVESMVAVTYVRDIDASRAFYELLGFSEQRAGQARNSAWLALYSGKQRLLLTATSPPLDIPRLPLAFYFFYPDLESVLAVLEANGVPVTRLGHAPHALGGEAKVNDPDGNTVLLGQPVRSPSRPAAEDEEESRFSLLREAAALVEARGGITADCQVAETGAQPCTRQAEVRIADNTGSAIWACMPHAEEILVMVPGAFVAAEQDQGIAAYLVRRRG